MMRQDKGESATGDPRLPGSEKLTRQDRYRYRQGQYRIIYEIRDQELVIIAAKVGRRKDVHKRV